MILLSDWIVRWRTGIVGPAMRRHQMDFRAPFGERWTISGADRFEHHVSLCQLSSQLQEPLQENRSRKRELEGNVTLTDHEVGPGYVLN